MSKGVPLQDHSDDDDAAEEDNDGPIVERFRDNTNDDDDDSLSFETEMLINQNPYTEVRDRPMESFPLFMDHIPEGGLDDNDDIAGIRELLEEGTPEERADNFKEQGNNCLAKKQYDDAIIFYGRAIELECKDDHRNSIFYSNRAAVQILKGNYGYGCSDCHTSIKFNPKNVKALFRLATCYYELRKLEEAKEYLEKCKLLTTGKQIQTLESKIEKLLKLRRQKEERRNKIEQEAARKKKQVLSYMKNAGYKLSSDDVHQSHLRLSANNASIKLVENTLIFPIVIIYPQGHTSDFICEWSEHSFMHDLLTTLFDVGSPRLEWDTANVYNNTQISNLFIYLKTNDRYKDDGKQEWVRLKASMTLGEALSQAHPDYCIPFVPTFYIFHKSFKSKFFGPEMQRVYGGVTAPLQK